MHHLFVSRAGDSLVNVTQNRNTYRLLANFDGTNVILLQIDAGSVVWLTPDCSASSFWLMRAARRYSLTRNARSVSISLFVV